MPLLLTAFFYFAFPEVISAKKVIFFGILLLITLIFLRLLFHYFFKKGLEGEFLGLFVFHRSGDGLSFITLGSLMKRDEGIPQ